MIETARRCGQSLNIITMGAGCLVILAKRFGLIASISSVIEGLGDAWLWLSNSIVNILQFQAGE